MGDLIDPAGASIDGLIGWLRQRRVARPDASLTELLTSCQVRSDRLVDLACIDLIERRRMGQPVFVEAYLDEFPDLCDESPRLDLIDAEWCVRSELGERPDVEEYVARFPDLAAAIRDLVSLDGLAMPLQSTQGHSSDSFTLNHESAGSHEAAGVSAEFSLGATSVGARSHQLASTLPVAIPDWFTSEKLVAISPGRWLVQGRDAKGGSSVAMKVVELPTDLTRAQHDQILDACEAASKVRHHAWVAPTVAAIAGQYLAVIRPWVFAQPWSQVNADWTRSHVLRQLSSVAFTLAAAHLKGATHGGVQPSNLLVDHSGKVHLVDAISTGHGLKSWLFGANSERTVSSDRGRVEKDVSDLVSLVVAQTAAWHDDSLGRFFDALRQTAQVDYANACGLIGEQLIRRSDDAHGANIEPAGGVSEAADTQAVQGRNWQGKLKRWLAGD